MKCCKLKCQIISGLTILNNNNSNYLFTFAWMTDNIRLLLP